MSEFIDFEELVTLGLPTNWNWRRTGRLRFVSSEIGQRSVRLLQQEYEGQSNPPRSIWLTVPFDDTVQA